MTFKEKHDRLLKEYNSHIHLLQTHVDKYILKRFSKEISKKLIHLSDLAANAPGITIMQNEYILFVNVLYKLTFE